MKKGFYTLGSLIILLIAAFVFVLVPVLTGQNSGATIPAFGKYEGTEIKYGDSDFDNYLSTYAQERRVLSIKEKETATAGKTVCDCNGQVGNSPRL